MKKITLTIITVSIALVTIAAQRAATTSHSNPNTPTVGETIVVNTVEDVVDFPAPQMVAQLPGPDGLVSFREAATAANNTAGPQTITFAIPQGDWWLLGEIALLKLEDGVFLFTDNDTTVDFSSQTALTGDTNPNGNEVGIYGLEPNGGGSPAIIVNGQNCVFRGLDAVFQRGYAIKLSGNNNRVVGCTISGPFFAAVYINGGFSGPPTTGNIVGGTAPGEGNTLSAGNSGVRIDGPATDNVVIGNLKLTGAFAGVEVRSAPLSNLFAINNRIGGPTAAERNLIAGAGHFGEEGFPTGAQVSLQDAVDTTVQGNYIGTNAAGTESFGQKGPSGILARNSTGTKILGNLISGILVEGVNHAAGQRFGIGVSLQGNDAGTIIRGNLIGTDVSGENSIPNRAGIVTSFWPGSSGPSAVAIGGIGDDDGNTIAFNETNGVTVDSSARGITIFRNSIRSNGALGIDLIAASGGGVTLNDSCDGDDGANALQNFPALQSAAVNAGGTTITGTLNSVPNSQFVIDFFSNPQCDPSGYGEGATYLGSATVNTDNNCNANFQAAVLPTAAGNSITATATQVATGNTSEFSACQIATQSTAPALQLVSAVSRKTHGSAGTFDINLPLSGMPAVESRSSNRAHTLVFAFTNNVVSGAASVESGTATSAGVSFSGNTMTVNLSGVTNAQLLTVRLSNVTDQFAQVLPDKSVQLRILIGDINGNGTVNASDVAQPKSHIGQQVGATNFTSDVNASGSINASDVAMIKANTGAGMR